MILPPVPVQEMSATGSITGGSDQLVLASNPGFVVGDWVIVETGGEAGAGARGTRGVGGTWPALSYADEAAMNADTSQDNNRACWLEATGNIWYWVAANPGWVAVDATDYYYVKAVPRALVAEITAIDGLTLTLSKTAETSATNATVHFDNWTPIQARINARQPVNLPAGRFAISCTLFANEIHDIIIAGAGRDLTTLWGPKGAGHAGIYLQNTDFCSVRDLTLDGNFRNSHYNFVMADMRVGTEANANLYYWKEEYRNNRGIGEGIVFHDSDDGVVRNFYGLNCAQHAITGWGAQRLWCYDCEVRVDDPIVTYIQWQIQTTDAITDGDGGGFVRCHIDSDYLMPGFNFFKMRDAQLIDCSMRNACFANNASDGTYIENMDIVINDDVYFNDASSPRGRGILEFSSNVGGGLATKRCTVKDTNIIQEGYVNRIDNWRYQNVIVAETHAPVDFIGTYPNDPNPRGLIQCQAGPHPSPSAIWHDDGVGIYANGEVTITGIRIDIEMPDPNNRLPIINGVFPISITNSVFDPLNTIWSNPITGGAQTFSGNQTNAEYEAG